MSKITIPKKQPTGRITGLTTFIKDLPYSILKLKIGNVANGDYAEFEEDGTLRYKGDATVWDDVVGSLYGRRL